MASPAVASFEIEGNSSGTKTQNSPAPASASAPAARPCGCGRPCCITIAVVAAILCSLIGWIVVKYVVGWKSLEIKMKRMEVKDVEWHGDRQAVTADVHFWLEITNPNDISGDLQECTVDINYVPRLLGGQSHFLATGSLPKNLALKAEGKTEVHVNVGINIDKTTVLAWAAFAADCAILPSTLQLQLTLRDVQASLNGSPNIPIKEFETGVIEAECPVWKAGQGAGGSGGGGLPNPPASIGGGVGGGGVGALVVEEGQRSDRMEEVTMV